MFDDRPGMIAELDAQVRSSAPDRDHSEHVLNSRLATVFGEFRNGLATVFDSLQVQMQRCLPRVIDGP